MPADRRVRGAAMVRAAALVISGLLAVPAGAQAPRADVDAVSAVAAAAVRDAFGGDAEVSLTEPVLQLVGGAGAVVTAVPEPGSRTAGPVRFVLYDASDRAQGTRVGRFTAHVRVRATQVRVRTAIASRGTLAADVLEVVREDVGRQPFGPMPSMDDVAGSTSRKPLKDGEIVTRAAIVARLLVTSGDEVVTIARVGNVEVRGRAIAAQSGALGDTVVVVNPDSRKRLQGRVVAGPMVEVLHAS